MKIISSFIIIQYNNYLSNITNGKPRDNSIDPPYLFPIPYNESHDIDNESEFIKVESLYSNLIINNFQGFKSIYFYLKIYKTLY